MWPSRHISAGKRGGVSTLCKLKMFQRVSRDAIKTISRVRKKIDWKQILRLYTLAMENDDILWAQFYIFSIHFCWTLSLESCPPNENPKSLNIQSSWRWEEAGGAGFEFRVIIKYQNRDGMCNCWTGRWEAKPRKRIRIAAVMARAVPAFHLGPPPVNEVVILR